MTRFFSIFLLFMFCVSVAAQSNDDEDLQQWNDLQVSVPLHKKLDLLLLAEIKFANNISLVSEGRGGAGLNWKITKELALSPSYVYIESRNSAGRFAAEHRVRLRGSYRFPIDRIGLTHRSSIEFRFRSSGYSWRYRPSITVEKSLPNRIISDAKIFLTEEPFYVSTTGGFTRNRISIGIAKQISPRLGLEVYYMRQNDGFSHPGDLNVIGTAWKVKL